MRLSRQEIAARVAQDIPDGAYVNLGIGVPTLVADFLPEDKEIILQTENGMLGMGPAAGPADVDPDLINAGKMYVTEKTGASYFHHADSFAMMRGGHLDYCIMGAFQVSIDGDLSNWRTNSTTGIPGVGGAMDLAIGAKHVYVIMDLFSKTGECKLVQACTYPLTGERCVERIYTDAAVFEVSGGRARVLEILDSDLDFAALESLVGVPLLDGAPTSSKV